MIDPDEVMECGDELWLVVGSEVKPAKGADMKEIMDDIHRPPGAKPLVQVCAAKREVTQVTMVVW